MTNVKEIGTEAFARCSKLAAINEFGNIVIGDRAFRLCVSLPCTIHFYDNVIIRDEAFLDCGQINKIELHGENVMIGSNSFSSISSLVLYQILNISSTSIKESSNLKVYYYGDKESPNTYENTIYEKVSRIYVKCDYKFASFFGRDIKKMCKICSCQFQYYPALQIRQRR